MKKITIVLVLAGGVAGLWAMGQTPDKHDVVEPVKTGTISYDVNGKLPDIDLTEFFPRTEKVETVEPVKSLETVRAC